MSPELPELPLDIKLDAELDTKLDGAGGGAGESGGKGETITVPRSNVELFGA